MAVTNILRSLAPLPKNLRAQARSRARLFFELDPLHKAEALRLERPVAMLADIRLASIAGGVVPTVRAAAAGLGRTESVMR